jgi:plasmid stabilization system protein ParE
MSAFIIDQDARDDMAWIAGDYESKQAGLGLRFLGKLPAELNRIRSNPGGIGRIHESARASLVRPFPVVVYFRIRRNHDIEVFAIRYGRERGTVWKRRYRNG